MFMHWCPTCKQLHSPCAGPTVRDPNRSRDDQVWICATHGAGRRLLCDRCERAAEDEYYSDPDRQA